MSKRIQNISKRDFIIFNEKGEKVKLSPYDKEWITDAEADRLLQIFPKELEVLESKSEPKKASNEEGKKDKKKDKEKSDLVKKAKELGIDGAEELSEGELLNLIQESASK